MLSSQKLKKEKEFKVYVSYVYMCICVYEDVCMWLGEESLKMTLLESNSWIEMT